MSELGRAFDAAQQRWDGMTEEDVYGPEVDLPEPDPHAHRWPRREAAIKRLANIKARKAALEINSD